MRIDELVRTIVIPAIGDCNYDPDAVFSGISEYIHDNGFNELKTRFSENVIDRVIKSNLAQVLNMKPESIALFFSNYRLIEKVRIVNNQALALADRIRTGSEASTDELQKIEADFDDCMVEVCSIEGLRAFLNTQISEIILNIDYARGAATRLSQRLSSIEDGKR